ncbi:MAG: hypothetical protein FJ403_12900 [Verrucomicrobia bacterium]|nr:hypothetical protein [Verrucomicrobiota bacterium]
MCILHMYDCGSVRQFLKVKKPLRQMIAWIVILAVIFGASSLSRRVEPRHGGKPISHWIQQRDERVVLQLGTNVLPYLVRNLEPKDSWSAKLKAKLWPQLPPFMKRALQKPVPAKTLRDSAVYGLLVLGRHAAPATSSLLELARNDSDRYLQLFAATSLLRVAPEDPRTQKEVLRLLREGHPTAFSDLTTALRYAGAHGQFAVPALIERVNEPGQLSHMALTGLKGIGRAAEGAVPHLLPLLKGANAEAALEALIAIEPTNPEVIGILEETFRDRPPQRVRVMQVFVSMRQNARIAAPFLRSCLTDDNQLVRVLAAFASGKLENSSTNTLSVVVSALMSTNRPNENEYWVVEPDLAFGKSLFGPQTAAAFYLGQIGPDAAPAASAPRNAALEDRALNRRIWPAHALWRVAHEWQRRPQRALLHVRAWFNHRQIPVNL